MSQSHVEDVIGTLLTAPAKAVTYANREQIAIWRDYLSFLSGMVSRCESEAEKAQLIARYVSMAPKWKVAAEVEVGMSMRIASVSKRAFGGSIGVAVGLLQSAGQFASETASTTESVLQAKAKYALSNDTEVALADYMSSMGIELVGEASLTNAMKHLETILPKELNSPSLPPQQDA